MLKEIVQVSLADLTAPAIQVLKARDAIGGLTFAKAVLVLMEGASRKEMVITASAITGFLEGSVKCW